MKRISSLASKRSYKHHSGIYGCHAIENSPLENNKNSLSQLKLEISKKSDGKSKKDLGGKVVDAFRKHGYLQAKLDPLGLDDNIDMPSSAKIPSTSPEVLKDPKSESSDRLLREYPNVADLINQLEHIYCSSSTLEASHVEDPAEREWLYSEYESMKQVTLSESTKERIAEVLLKSQEFDRYIGVKFPNVKRYSGEGAESMLAFCDSLFECCPGNDVKNVIIGIAHRGRLNLLTLLLHYPAAMLFRKMKGLSEFPEEVSDAIEGDVLSHLFTTCDLENGARVSLLPNPSHLEAVNPVCIGKTRSKQSFLSSGCYGDNSDDAVCFLIHGDGAFAGQGVVAECFNMAYTPQYNVGGTIHLITNNQLGFTMQKGRSSRYVSDMAKIISCPVIHMNGNQPEDAFKAAQLCSNYRKKFRKDIVVDLVCYRKWGHNELDDASLTQPIMYKQIDCHSSPPDSYLQELEKSFSNSGDLESLKMKIDNFKKYLESERALSESVKPPIFSFKGQWSGYGIPSKEVTTWDTGVDTDSLRYVGSRSVTFPEDFNIQPKLLKTLSQRLGMMESGQGLDWATAEALAFGSLLIQGHNVRISGQDVGRGTFSHRHCHVTDQVNEKLYIPLNNLETSGRIGKLEVANSILSEEAVLGFEYGFSVDNPRCLVIWEAQFGDFFNGAQIIIDTFVASGESKWLLQSGLVMLLPHGLDGMGPEHSSCRVERFLQLTDSSETAIDSDRVNMTIMHPTTPAQYFHALRQQQVRPFRKPLVIMAPKKLLRDPNAKSNLSELAPGTHFKPVIGDETASMRSQSVKKVIFVCGKLFYSLFNERSKLGKNDNVALIRVEQLTPFPAQDLQKEVSKYPNCEDFVWVQEECRNSGAWSFVDPRFRNLVGVNLRYVGRNVKPVPASGIGVRQREEEEAVIKAAFK